MKKKKRVIVKKYNPNCTTDGVAWPEIFKDQLTGKEVETLYKGEIRYADPEHAHVFFVLHGQ